MRRRRLPIAVAAAGVLAVLVIAGGAWYVQPQPLLPQAGAALTSTASVSYTDTGAWLSFTPVGPAPTTGLIFYPGAKVPPAAYAPAAQAIAAAGYDAFIVEMPLDFAILGIDKALDVEHAHPEVTRWVLGGHSLGGAMAAQFLAGHTAAAAGLVFWASYSASDLSALAIPVASIYGTLDAGAATYSSAANVAKLPRDLTFTVIAGGNHQQMGYYTGQPNDPPATIALDAQQGQVVGATLALLAKVAGG